MWSTRTRAGHRPAGDSSARSRCFASRRSARRASSSRRAPYRRRRMRSPSSSPRPTRSSSRRTARSVRAGSAATSSVRSTRAAKGIPVRHVIAEDEAAVAEKNVLVIANETVISTELLDRIRERAKSGPGELPDRRAAVRPRRRRWRPTAVCAGRFPCYAPRASTLTVRSSHPDPFTAALNAVHDERVDEIILSTFPQARSGWLRRDLLERLRTRDGPAGRPRGVGP